MWKKQPHIPLSVFLVITFAPERGMWVLGTQLREKKSDNNINKTENSSAELISLSTSVIQFFSSVGTLKDKRRVRATASNLLVPCGLMFTKILFPEQKVFIS